MFCPGSPDGSPALPFVPEPLPPAPVPPVLMIATAWLPALACVPVDWAWSAVASVRNTAAARRTVRIVFLSLRWGRRPAATGCRPARPDYCGVPLLAAANGLFQFDGTGVWPLAVKAKAWFNPIAWKLVPLPKATPALKPPLPTCEVTLLG